MRPKEGTVGRVRPHHDNLCRGGSSGGDGKISRTELSRSECDERRRFIRDTSMRGSFSTAAAAATVDAGLKYRAGTSAALNARTISSGYSRVNNHKSNGSVVYGSARLLLSGNSLGPQRDGARSRGDVTGSSLSTCFRQSQQQQQPNAVGSWRSSSAQVVDVTDDVTSGSGSRSIDKNNSTRPVNDNQGCTTAAAAAAAGAMTSVDYDAVLANCGPEVAARTIDNNRVVQNCVDAQQNEAGSRLSDASKSSVDSSDSGNAGWFLNEDISSSDLDVFSVETSLPYVNWDRLEEQLRVALEIEENVASMQMSSCSNNSSSSSSNNTDSSANDVKMSTSSEDEHDFLSQQARLQAEARLALAQVRPMARMQLQLEKQHRRKSPIADIVGIPGFGDGRQRRLSRYVVLSMRLPQLQVVVNDMLAQIEAFNVELMSILEERDDLHMAQDSMLVDIEDLSRRAQECDAQLKAKLLQETELPCQN